MQLFYDPDLEPESGEFTVSKDESRHLVKVLRMKTGDPVYFTNGRGWLFRGLLDISNPKRCLITIEDKSYHEDRTHSLHLAVAPTKMNDRFEWFLEKATEIGVQFITPIICEHSERKTIKQDRMKKIILSAMKQSKRLHLPVLNDAISFDSFLKNTPGDQKFIAHCHSEELPALKDKLGRFNNTTICIGPEGDFSVKEIEMALQHGFIPVNLGASRLRTETAAIVACHTVALTYD